MEEGEKLGCDATEASANNTKHLLPKRNTMYVGFTLFAGMYVLSCIHSAKSLPHSHSHYQPIDSYYYDTVLPEPATHGDAASLLLL